MGMIQKGVVGLSFLAALGFSSSNAYSLPNQKLPNKTNKKDIVVLKKVESTNDTKKEDDRVKKDLDTIIEDNFTGKKLTTTELSDLKTFAKNCGKEILKYTLNELHYYYLDKEYIGDAANFSTTKGAFQLMKSIRSTKNFKYLDFNGKFFKY